MLVATLNVEGLGSALDNGLLPWLEKTKPDILALQEIWSLPKSWDQGWPEEFLGMHACWNPSQTKPGASGTALLSKEKPGHVSFECGIPRMDGEGRWVLASFKNLSVLNLYIPYFWSQDPKQDKPCKELLDAIREAIASVLEKHERLLVVGDFNIAPALHRDYTNTVIADKPGTWPYKKVWMKSLGDLGLADIHGHLEHDPESITWYNRRLEHAKPGRRKGTRIDYHLAAKDLAAAAQSYGIDCATAGFGKNRISDHCAVLARYGD